jgi:CubicO group peptidase (beta-lactamase class C family)
LRKAYKRALAGLGVVAVAAAIAGLLYASRYAAIGAAYAAKLVCSGVFVSQRDARSVFAEDVAADDLSFLRYMDVKVDRGSREVQASFFGLGSRKAVYREGQGCAVAHGEAAARPASHNAGPAGSTRAQPAVKDDLEIAGGSTGQSDRSRLQAALQWAFSEPNPALLRRTRAVVVLHKGRLVAERYAEGFTKDTPLPGWSMAKSVENALVGILVKEGKLSVSDPLAIPEWSAPDDPRRKITLEHLLRMSSGLQFREDYRDPLADVTYMLFGAADAGAYAAAKPLEAAPGTRWSYSSGTSNIIARAMRRTVGDTDYLDFPRRALFEQVGMASAVMETDAGGTFVGSSFMYATARDWARFGLLYLHDGVWAGKRILPEGWVAYARTPAPSAAERHYGAHFWLRVSRGYRCGGDEPLPADSFHAIGFGGQFITVIPSRELVLVRLGLTRYPCAWDQQRFVHLVLATLAPH